MTYQIDSPNSTTTTTPSTSNDGFFYSIAVLNSDITDHQAQLDNLRNDVLALKREFVVSSGTEVSAPTNRHLSYKQSPIPIVQIPQSLLIFTNVGYSGMDREAQGSFSPRTSSATVEVGTSAAAIPLHALLKFAGIFMAALAVASIAFWLSGRPAILNPFVSLLTLVAAPFAFVMGIAAKRK